MSERQYNLKRDPVDERDYKFAAIVQPTKKVRIPRKVDLRKNCPSVWNQLNLGSCTANAGTSANAMLRGNPLLELSRLYLYYKIRELEGTIGQDSGGSMRDICKALQKSGCCKEEFFPYNVARFTVPPTAAAELDAANYKVVSYRGLSSIEEIKQCVALRQQPVLIGMAVFKQFETIGTSGKMKLPTPNEHDLGGHAVLVVGYKDGIMPGTGYLIVRNSWGAEWGDKGYFYMPYSYVIKGYSWDFWSLEGF